MLYATVLGFGLCLTFLLEWTSKDHVNTRRVQVLDMPQKSPAHRKGVQAAASSVGGAGGSRIHPMAWTYCTYPVEFEMDASSILSQNGAAMVVVAPFKIAHYITSN